jgi:putative ABC transport system substrate-binding protein
LNITLQQFLVRQANEFDGVFTKIGEAQCDSVAVFEDAIMIANTATIAQLSAKQRLPLTGFVELAKDGGLIGYGADLPALFRRAGYFVDRILHGVRPADIPVEQPTKFETVINLKTAKALGLSVPIGLLNAADEVIE